MKEALEYLRLGWSIIPLKPRSKEPDGPWAEFSQRIMAPSEVSTRFNAHSGVGIVTGRISGLVVIDIDPGRGGKLDHILDRYPTGRVVKTGGGGYHLYYRYPKSGTVGNHVDILPGIDIRGDGGQVVAPPTVHASGARYAWVQEGPLAEFPTSILKKSEGTARGSGKDGWALSLLSSGAPEGSRDDSTAKLAGLLARHGLPEEVAVGLLRNWNRDKNPAPLPDTEIDKTVRSVYRTDRRRSAQESTQEGFRLVPITEFMSEFMKDDMEWLIEGWLPDKTILFVIAAPGTYKTWLTFDAAVSVATGKPFLGMAPVKRTGPVLIIQQEDYNGQTAERLSVIIHSRLRQTRPHMDGDTMVIPDAPDIPIFIHPDRKLRFDDEESMKNLRAAVERLRPALVIIDPLYAASSTENFMAEAAGQMSPLKNMRDEFGTSFCIVHHAKKGSDPRERERLWGSQFLNAFMESGWQVAPDGPTGSGAVVVGRHFKAAPPQDDVCIKFLVDTTNEGFIYAPTVSKGAPAGESAEKSSKVSSIEDILGAEGLSVQDAADKIGVHRTTAFRALKKLEKEGKVMNRGGKWVTVGSVL